MDETPLTECWRHQLRSRKESEDSTLAEMNQANRESIYAEGFDSGVEHGKTQLAVAIFAIAKLWKIDPAIEHKDDPYWAQSFIRKILDLCADFMHE